MVVGYNHLCADLRVYILRYLPPADLFSYFQVDLHLNNLYGRDLMQQSLVSSLGARLNGTTIGNIIPAFTVFAATLPLNSFLISGSIVLQSIFGAFWPCSDVDFYCSYEVADRVRSWLMQHTDLVLTDWKPYYSLIPGEESPSEQAIHHIERYVDAVGIENEVFEDSRGRAWTFRLQDTKRRRRIRTKLFDPIDEDDDDYIIRTVEGGALIRVERKLKTVKADVDLVVSRPNLPPVNIIHGFDIKACECYFNGYEVFVPTPHQTFQRKTALNMTPSNLYLCEYMNCMKSQCEREFTSILRQVSLIRGGRMPTGELQQVLTWMNLPIGSNQDQGSLIFREELDHPPLIFQEELDHPGLGGLRTFTEIEVVREFLIKSAVRQMCQRGIRYMECFDFEPNPVGNHNFLIRMLFARIIKYIGRGFSIVNLPPYDDNVMRRLPETFEL